MNISEFSNEFSVLLNSFGLTPNIVLDEYEKSVFLTQAQEELIIEAYSGRNPQFGGSFEETEELRTYLSTLVQTRTFTDKDAVTFLTGLTPYSVMFTRLGVMWFITYESAKLEDSMLGCRNGSVVEVVPVAQDELHRIIDNPFRGPSKKRVLRLNSDRDTLELISKYHISEYTVRYLIKPTPIILVKLGDNLSINGQTRPVDCTLPESLHRTILNRAVRLAIIAKTQLSSNK